MKATSLRATGFTTAAVLAAALARSAGADSLTWNAAGGVWSAPGNWTPSQMPATGDDITFALTGSGATSTQNIAGLGIASLKLLAPAVAPPTAPTPVSHTVALSENLAISGGPLHVAAGTPTGQGANGSLTITGPGTLTANLTDLVVGTNAQTSGATTANGGPITTGVLDLSGLSGGSVTVTGATAVARNVGGTGTVTFGSGMNVQLGASAASRGTLEVGAGMNAKSGTLTMGTGAFNAYLSALNVGHEVRGNVPASFNGGGDTRGTLDLTAATAGTIDVVGPVRVGHGLAAGGSVLLGENVTVTIGTAASRNALSIGGAHSVNTPAPVSQLVAGGNTFNARVSSLVVGQGIATATLDLGRASGVLDVSGSVEIASNPANTAVTNFGATGRVTLGDDMDLVIGSQASRGSLSILTGLSPKEGSLTMGAGTFTAYLSTLTVGRNDRPNWSNSTLPGTLDLSEISGGVLDISGAATIGYNGGANFGGIQGVVNLHETAATAATLNVGDVTANTRGTLQLDNSTFAVSGATVITGPTAALRGRVITLVNGESSGLDLGPGATLTVGTQGLIDITFAAPDGDVDPIYWGLRWEGSHVSDLQALASAGKLVWNDAALVASGQEPVSIFSEGGFTYVGSHVVVPEPAAAGLVAVGGTLVLLRRRGV